MVYDIIVEGLGQTLGYEVLVVGVFILAFSLLLVSRGLGITAIFGAMLFTAHLFNENLISGRQLLANEWYVVIIIIVGLLMGYIVYNYFLK